MVHILGLDFITIIGSVKFQLEQCASICVIWNSYLDIATEAYYCLHCLLEKIFDVKDNGAEARIALHNITYTT